LKKLSIFLLLSLFSVSIFAYSLNDVLLNNFNTAMTLAKYENKPSIIIFSDPTCYYCNKLKNDTLSVLSVQRFISNNFIMAEIYQTNDLATFEGKVYTYSQLFSGFGIQGTPTLFFFTPDGTPITYLPGYLGPSDFTKLLQYVALKEYVKKVDFNTFVKTPNSFIGTPQIIKITQSQAAFILNNDPMAKKIDALPSSGADLFLKYLVYGNDANSIASTMLKNGFYNIYVVD
jgi:thioredoxin-related protein